jgi:Icc protein
MGQHPAPDFTLIHLSDTHFLADRGALYGAVDTDHHLTSALTRIAESGFSPDAIVITGDIADLGEADAYRRVRSVVEPVAESYGIPIAWVMGNHDKRIPFAAELFDVQNADQTQDRVWQIGGLRIIAIDTSVPGYNHGDLTDEQLDWLSQQLSTPSPAGTILAMHHPPLPCPIEIMGIIELQEQRRLASVVAGTDVRAILAGHLHYSTFGTFAGIPVSVASATCYTMDLSTAPRELIGADGSQSFNLVEIFKDRVVHSIIPAHSSPTVNSFSSAFLADLERMSAIERLEKFSRQQQSVENP